MASPDIAHHDRPAALRFRDMRMSWDDLYNRDDPIDATTFACAAISTLGGKMRGGADDDVVAFREAEASIFQQGAYGWRRRICPSRA